MRKKWIEVEETIAHLSFLFYWLDVYYNKIGGKVRGGIQGIFTKKLGD